MCHIDSMCKAANSPAVEAVQHVIKALYVKVRKKSFLVNS